MAEPRQRLDAYREELSRMQTPTAESIGTIIDRAPVLFHNLADVDWGRREQHYRKIFELCKKEGKKTLIMAPNNPELFGRLTQEYDVKVYRCETKEEIPASETSSVIWVPPSFVKIA